MNPETVVDLAKYGPTGALIIFIVAFFFFTYKIICLATPLFQQFQVSIDANTKATTEMHEFMKNLNGRLRQAVKDKLS